MTISNKSAWTWLFIFGSPAFAPIFASGEDARRTTQSEADQVASISWEGFDGIVLDDFEQAQYSFNGQCLGDGEEGFVGLIAKMAELPIASKVVSWPTSELAAYPARNRFEVMYETPPLFSGYSPILLDKSYMQRFKDVVAQRQLNVRWSIRDPEGNMPSRCQPRPTWRAPIDAEKASACKQWLARLGKEEEYDAYELRLSGKEVTSESVKHLGAMPHLRRLRLLGGTITDADMPSVAALDRLRFLELLCVPITDEGLADLFNMRELRELHIDSCKHITDAGMPYLSRLTRLQDLSLIDVQVTDKGLVYLERLNLLGLTLIRMQTTDAGLPSLKRMVTLRSLRLSDTAVTRKAVKELRKSEELPFCTISANSGSDFY